MKPPSAFTFHPVALSHLTLFLFLALAWTWPLATRLSWLLPHDPGDPVLNTWILWWNTQALPFSDAWWSPPIFYPMRGALALSEHLAGIAVFTAPLLVAGLDPIAAFNLSLILSCWMSGYVAFLLGRHLTGSTAAGMVAGVAFAIAPYRAGQLSHLQVLTAQWMPLALLAMHGFLREGRARWLVLLAIAWLLQALSNGYYLLFFPIVVALWLLWFVDWRRQWQRGLALVVTFAATSLLLVPSLLKYQDVHSALGLQRSRAEMVMFSATFSSFVQPAHLLKFWPSRNLPTQEGFLFPGMTVIVLALLGAVALVARGKLRPAFLMRSAGIFYGVTALLLWWLCFGPAEETSVGSALRHPYTLLTTLPGFDGLRVPARFAMVAALCISLAAAIAVARLTASGGTRRALAAALAGAGLFVDGWIDPLPLSPPPQRVAITAPRDAVVIELPVDRPSVSTAAMYRAISHGRPLVNGYSGYTPPHYTLLSSSLRRGDPSTLLYLARGRTLMALVHRIHDSSGGWRTLVQQAGGVLLEESAVGPLFVISPQPIEHTPELGPPLPATAVRHHPGYATVDIGSPAVVRAITIALRWRHEEIGPRMTVEASTDGRAWTNVWENWTGAAALAAALEDQRTVPMRIFLPGVRAQYLRIRPAPYWLEREITVYR